jgi:O-antigen/teichoic acid export membrane protein
MKWFAKLLRSADARHGMLMGIAMILAGGLEYGIFISVMAILQVLLLLAIAIRMVVAYYTAELAARNESARQVGPFVRRAWRWAWTWGLATALLMAAAGPKVAHWLWLPNAWPLWAASFMVLMLFVRETAYGAMQGTLSFTGLGLAQVLQALLRLVFAALLIALGGQAASAIVAQPIACAVAVWMVMPWLRPVLRSPDAPLLKSVSWRYSAHTVAGLAAFGLMTNLDAIFVKRFYSPEIAGDYAPVVTLAKISLFLPWALGIVLFPKVTQRQATGRDPRPILWMSLAAALAPGLALSTVYLLFPQLVVSRVFANGYHNPGAVLGLASLAATFYAGANIWLNYALSLGRQAYTYVLMALIFFQFITMFTFGRSSLVNMTLTMVACGLIGNLTGLIATWSGAPKQSPEVSPEAEPGVQPEAAPSGNWS